MKSSTISYDEKSDLYLPSIIDAPYARQLHREFSMAMEDFMIPYNSSVAIIGSTYGTSERNALFNGASVVTTIEPYSKHIDFLKEVRSKCGWYTPFQKWHIIRASLRNTYRDTTCRDTYCLDNLHIMPITSLSTIESRGRYMTDDHELVKTYRLLQLMELLYRRKIYPQILIMDFDGVGSVITNKFSVNVIEANDYKVLFRITDGEMARLHPFVETLNDAYSSRKIINQINKNFFSLS